MHRALTYVLTAAVVAAGALAAIAVRSAPARADDPMTLYMSGFEIGPGRRAIVRLQNTSTHASDVFTVHYTVRDPGAGIPISRIGAGDGAPLRSGETLELDLGQIVDDYRAEIEAGTYEGPVQFVAFATGGNFATFGPTAVVAEGLQQIRRANFAIAVDWALQ